MAKLLGLLCFVFSVTIAQAGTLEVEIEVDTAAARATLSALSNEKLDRAEAERIARLPGNVALVRKQAGFKSGGTEARFVEELIAQAQGQKPSGTAHYRFASIAKEAPGIERTLAIIENDKPAFVRAVRERIDPYSPKRMSVSLRGYIIVGGGSSGFAFGENDFYLNIGHYGDQIDTARLIMAHELYHAIQGAAVNAAGLRATRGFDELQHAALTDRKQQRAYAVESFLYNLYTEGTAMYVGDVALMTGDGYMAKFERSRLEQQSGRLDRLATQLDMSLIALTADQPIEYDRAYALGFYGPDQPLYYLGYAMAKAIVAKRGADRLGELITTSGCGFMQEYLMIAAEDATLPQMGEPTKRLVRQHCRARG